MTTSILFAVSLALSGVYLTTAFFSGAYFFSGRRVFSVITDLSILLALPVHLGYLVALGIVSRKLPYTSFFEALSVVAFLITFISSLLHVAFKVRSAAIFAFPLVFVAQLLSAVGSRVVYLNEDLFRSALFGTHTLSTLLGYASFAYSMILGLMYLHLLRQLKHRRLRHMYDRLPPLELLERMNDVALTAGFLFLTAGITLGSLLALRVWGRIPFTDPKILLSMALWVVYLVGLLLRRALGWSGRRLSSFGVLGFGVLVIFMVAVRILLPTFHRF